MSEDDTRGGVLGFAATPPPPQKPPGLRTVVIAVSAVVIVIALAVTAVLLSSRGESGTAVPVGVPSTNNTTEAGDVTGQGSGIVRPAADKSLRLQPADAAATAPFAASPAAKAVTFSSAAAAKIDGVLAELIFDLGTETKLADGDTPALFAAQPDQVACDVTGMAASLAADQSVATAFTAPLGIESNQLAGFLGTLAPVALAHDTVVVNHDYVDGDAAAVNAVLQAGTPVLVDATGIPRVRCSGASPLAAPDGAGYPDFVMLGTPWAGYLVDEVLVIEPAAAVSSLTVVDATSGKLVQVNVGGGNGAPAAAGEVCSLLEQSSLAEPLVAVTKTPEAVTCQDMQQRWTKYDAWVQNLGEGAGLVFTFGDNWTCTGTTNDQMLAPGWSGTVGRCAARNSDEGSFTVYAADRYDPSATGSSTAGPISGGQASGTAGAAPTTTTVPPAVGPSTPAPAGPAAPAAAAPVPGDLGLTVAMTRPACDGSGIVVVASAVGPGSYAADVQGFLDQNPGASYLRTDQACLSLNQATSSGAAIYAVYFPAGSSDGAICDVVERVGGEAYGKRLDNSTDPSATVDC